MTPDESCTLRIRKSRSNVTVICRRRRQVGYGDEVHSTRGIIRAEDGRCRKPVVREERRSGRDGIIF